MKNISDRVADSAGKMLDGVVSDVFVNSGAGLQVNAPHGTANVTLPRRRYEDLGPVELPPEVSACVEAAVMQAERDIAGRTA